MIKKLVVVILACLCLTGCGAEQTESEVISTEVPKPDTVSDTVQYLTYDEITVSYTVNGNQALGIGDDSILVYENSESFNSAVVEIRYMPRYSILDNAIDDCYMSEISNGYVAVVWDYGIGEATCRQIASSIKMESFTDCSM